MLKSDQSNDSNLSAANLPSAIGDMDVRNSNHVTKSLEPSYSEAAGWTGLQTLYNRFDIFYTRLHLATTVE